MSDYTKATNFTLKDGLTSGDPGKVIKGSEIDDEFDLIASAIASKADINNPGLTGTPTAPTASVGTNTTQLATTAYVYAERANTITLTNKTIDLTNNTLTGTTTQFNTALSDDSFATLTGTETLTNKTLTSPTLSSPSMTGTPSAPTAAYGTDTTQVATTAFVQSAIEAAYPVGSVYINASVATNPGTLFGFGSWIAFGTGRVMVGIDSSDSSFNTIGETGGSKNATVVSHTHTATSSVTDPGHKHTITNFPLGYTVASGSTLPLAFNSGNKNTNTAYTGISVSTSVSSTGSSGTNANLQPYITVYMWKRTA
jgi:hypothetical protein